MTKIQVFAILTLGGLVALGASGQTGGANLTNDRDPGTAQEKTR